MQRSALILAGGKGTRLGEREKALLIYKGRTLLEKTIDVLSSVVDEVIVSVRDQRQQEDLYKYLQDIKILCDAHQEKGPLGGMLEGMRGAAGKYVFVVACDMPFIRSDVIDFLFNEAVDHDAVIPMWKDGRKEPLHSVYNRERFVPVIERSIQQDDYRVMAAVSQLHDVRFIDVDRIQFIDEELVSFSNINTPADLEHIIQRGARDHG